MSFSDAMSKAFEEPETVPTLDENSAPESPGNNNLDAVMITPAPQDEAARRCEAMRAYNLTLAKAMGIVTQQDPSTPEQRNAPNPVIT